MKFHIIALSLTVLTACTAEQDPAPVEFKGSGPVSSPRPAPAPVVRSSAPDARGVIVYPDYAAIQARSGDSIDAMAGRAGVAPSELAAYNGLPTNYTPQPGDELVLPPRPGGYQVTAAAPLSGPISEPLAPATGTEPAAWNPAAIGSALESSDGEPVEPQIAMISPGPEPARGVDVAGQSVISHQVAPGETIYSISALYEVSTETLIDWNNLVGPSYTVYPGQILSVPAVSSLALIADPSAPSTNLGGAISPSDQSLTTLAPAPATTAPTNSVSVEPLQSPRLGQYQTEPEPEVAIIEPAPAPVREARLAPPVSGRIVKRYNKSSGAARNDGVDFAASPGEEVRAAADGQVALVSRSLGGLGNIVLIRHDSEILTVYGRIGEINVAKGAQVRRGQVIGTVAPASAATGSTLHFEVRRGAVSVDPEDYL